MWGVGLGAGKSNRHFLAPSFQPLFRFHDAKSLYKNGRPVIVLYGFSNEQVREHTWVLWNW